MIIETSNRNKLWVRSNHGWVGGVFEGLGKSFNVDPNILRVFWLISVFIFGSGLILYPIFALALPREDKMRQYEENKVLGVCLRIAHRTGVELGIIRLFTIFFFLISFGFASILYIILYFVMPVPENRIYLQN